MTMQSRKTAPRVVRQAIVLVALTLAAGCTTTKTSDPMVADWISVLSETIESPYTTHFSPDSSFVLAASAIRPTTQVPNPSLHFVVVERETAVVLQDSKPGPARVEWFDAQRLRVLLTPGMVPVDGGASGYLLQVRTGERASLPR
jgi:hypothetical protein